MYSLGMTSKPYGSWSCSECLKEEVNYEISLLHASIAAFLVNDLSQIMTRSFVLFLLVVDDITGKRLVVERKPLMFILNTLPVLVISALTVKWLKIHRIHL